MTHHYEKLPPKNKLCFGTQKDFLTNENDELDLDFLGRFEALEDDYQKICGIIGVNNKLKHKNQSLPVYNYVDYYEKDLIDLVADFYKKDIEAFNYSFR
ncbi:MAG: hypothetical protein R3E32_29400 [Chitinophagales bacterium]